MQGTGRVLLQGAASHFPVNTDGQFRINTVTADIPATRVSGTYLAGLPVLCADTDIGLNARCPILLADFKQNCSVSCQQISADFCSLKIFFRNQDIFPNFQTYTKGRASTLEVLDLKCNL